MCHLRLLLVFCICWSSGVQGAVADSRITGFRVGAHADKTRIVLELSEPAQYSLLPRNQGDVVSLVLKKTSWAAGSIALPGQGGLVQAVRKSSTGDGLQLDLQMRQEVTASRPFYVPAQDGKPLRIVLDVRPGGAVPAPATASAPAPLSPSVAALKEPYRRPPDVLTAPAPPPPPVTAKSPVEAVVDAVTPAVAPAVTGGAVMARPHRRTTKPVIVIDPGHGGQDPGALGPTGTREKDITLRTALELRDALLRTGLYTVYLTRGDDRFIPLRERSRIAQRHGANLFISIHADSHPNPKVQGASVYTLSDRASDREAARLASRENKADAINDVDLSREANEVSQILIDLVQRETMNASAQYATYLTQSLGKRITVLQNTHRFAGFVVLLAPDTPSVLLEMGFISNERQEWLLKQRSYRSRIVEGIVEATNRFFGQKVAQQR